MSYGKFYSPAKVESDQKDIIIAQLKADIFEQRKQEEGFYALEDDLRKLELKLKRSIDERLLQDAEFRVRHDQAVKQISQLRNEAESVQQAVRARIHELNSFKEENLKLAEMGDLRAVDIQVSKRELLRLREESFSQTDHFDRLHEQSEHVDDEACKAQQRNSDLQRATEELHQKCRDKERVISMLRDQLSKAREVSNILSEDNQQFHNSNSHFTSELKEIEQHNNENNKQYRSNETRHKKLIQEADIAQDECQLSQKKVQSETQRIQDLQGKLLQTGVMSEQLEKDLNDIQFKWEQCKEHNDDTDGTNQQMREDLIGIKKHMDTLMQENQSLIQIMEQSCEEDEQIKMILNRSTRLNQMYKRVEGAQRIPLKKSPLKESHVTKSKRRITTY